jgi:hypothetical protein
MKYSQECSEDPGLLAATRDHVIRTLSSMASETDNELELAREVVVSMSYVPGTDNVLITGELNRSAKAPYLTGTKARGLISNTFVEGIKNGLDKYGVKWRILPGAATRGNGTVWGVMEGMIVHHTATPKGTAPSVLIEGRPDLSGPLCNSAGEADGTIAFVAYNPANHAGASGGRSMGALPVVSSFNKRVWGHEIVYPGTEAMNPEQYRSAAVLGRVISDQLGGNPERIRAHAETSITGKWDPGYALNKTIDMASFRGAVRDLVFRKADMEPDQIAKLDLIYVQLAGDGSKAGEFKGWPTWPGGSTNPDGSPARWSLVDYMRGMDVRINAVARIVAGLAAQGKADVDEKQVAALLGPVIAEAVRDALGKDNDGLADDIINRLGAKLAS